MKILINVIIIVLGFIIYFNELLFGSDFLHFYKLIGIPLIGFGFINLREKDTK
jgi:hypothetical protein